MGPDNVHEGHTENAKVMTLNNPYLLIYYTVLESLHSVPNKQLDIWTGLFISPEVQM